MIRLACSDYTFPLLSHEHAIQLVAMMEFEGIDIGLMGGRSHVRPEDVRSDIPKWSGILSDRVRSAGLKVADLFVIPWTDFERMAPNHPDARQRNDAAALFRDMLELAVGINADGITILPGIDWPGESHEDCLQRASQELAWRAEEAAKVGLRFSVEAHTGSVVGSPAQAARLIEMTPGLKLTLDYSHFVVQGMDEAEIDPLIRHAGHFHARGVRQGQLQAPVKDNSLDYNRVVDLLRQEGYDGWIAVEYVWTEWQRCNECDNVSESLLLRDWLKSKLAGRDWRYVPPPV